MNHRLKFFFEEGKKVGKNQKECAEYLGITHRAMNRIVSNPEHDLKASQINKIASYLEITPVEIYQEPILKLINCFQDKDDHVYFYDNKKESHFLNLPASSHKELRRKDLITMQNLNKTREWDFGFILFFTPFIDPRTIDKTEVFGLIESEDKSHYELCVLRKPTTNLSNNRYNVSSFMSFHVRQNMEVKEIAQFMASSNAKMFNYKTVQL